MWTAWCHGAKIIDFGDSLQRGETAAMGVGGLAREGKLDSLASAWLLSCHLGTSLAAQLAPA